MAEVAYAGIVERRSGARIESGRLRPGERVPSTRQITREWGVAMATATKVLTRAAAGGPGGRAAGHRDGRRDRAASAPGVAVGSCPVERRPACAWRSPGSRWCATAIAIADAEGSAALSMRRVATELGVATMSLYRHVPSKDELVVQMVDTVFGDHPFPAPPPVGWRAGLEAGGAAAVDDLPAAPVGGAGPVAHPAAGPRPDPRPRRGRAARARRHRAGRVPDVPGPPRALRLRAGHRRRTGVGRGRRAGDRDQRRGVPRGAGRGVRRRDRVRCVSRRSSGSWRATDFDLDLDEQFEFGLRHLLDGFAASLPGLRLR